MQPIPKRVRVTRRTLLGDVVVEIVDPVAEERAANARYWQLVGEEPVELDDAALYDMWLTSRQEDEDVLKVEPL